jgi:cell division protein FtsX
MSKRSGLAKLGLVIGGYAAACLVASGVVYVYQLLTQSAASQASAGMYAFGDLLLFVGVFGVLALFPTGLALYFLFRKFLNR